MCFGLHEDDEWGLKSEFRLWNVNFLKKFKFISWISGFKGNIYSRGVFKKESMVC